LTDSRRLRQSLDDYLETTPEYKELLADWEQRKQENPDADRPEPGQVMEHLLTDGLPSVRLFQRRDAVVVRLSLPQPPYGTNGAWEARAGLVTWNGQTDEHDVWPTFCYCLWTEPNAEHQERLFGRVALSGRPLADYVLWYRGLATEEAAEWDAYLAELRPENLEAQLLTFRFSAEKAAGLSNADESLAAPAREILITALKAPQDE
jgi:hypothetical protein